MTHTAAKYDDWARELEAELARYAKLRRDVRRYPLYALITAPLGFLWTPLAAVAIFLGWLAIWGTTLYITAMRTWQYKAELLETRAEALRLRDEGPPPPVAG